MQGNLRVGIFSMCDLKEGTELTFDYKWSKSARPPTRCHCGTESCRGYLEVLTEYDKAELRNQKGAWRPGGEPLTQPSTKQSTITTVTETVTETANGESSSVNTADKADTTTSTTATTTTAPSPVLNDIYNSDGLLVPELLIGRRVKVWWAGNLSYLEADVVSYNKKNNMYTCRYLVDDSCSEEDFGASVGSMKNSSSNSNGSGNGNSSNSSGECNSSTGIGAVTVKWYWRDTSAEERIIKKKVNIVFCINFTVLYITMCYIAVSKSSVKRSFSVYFHFSSFSYCMLFCLVFKLPINILSTTGQR